MVNDTSHGLDWSAHATLLNHPFTIEMVFTPMVAPGASQIFDTDGTTKPAGTYRAKGSEIGRVTTIPSSVADVSPMASGSTWSSLLRRMTFTYTSTANARPTGRLDHLRRSPGQALFFKDDGRASSEDPHALIEAIRISSVNRTDDEIADVQSRLTPGE